MEWIILTLTICLVSCVYVIYNMLKKHDKLEDTLLQQDDVIRSSEEMFKLALKHMKETDSKGGFESDDEEGQIFTSIKEIILLLENELESKKW